MTKKRMRQSDNSYRNTLDELQRRVRDNVRLEFYDCTDYGAKNTECTLGLCDDTIQEMQDGVYREKHHICPHDARYFNANGERNNNETFELTGCFYSCMVFNPKNSNDRGLAQKRINTVMRTLPKREPLAKDRE